MSSMMGPRQAMQELKPTGAGSSLLANESQISCLRSAEQGPPCSPQPQSSWTRETAKLFFGHPLIHHTDRRVMYRFCGISRHEIQNENKGAIKILEADCGREVRFVKLYNFQDWDADAWTDDAGRLLPSQSAL